MLFDPLPVLGACVIRPEPRPDHRGHFARIWCHDELTSHGYSGHIAQINTGFNPRAGTMRGMHFQVPPHAEVKIARCTRGSAFDVVLDLRAGSPTFLRWAGVRLTADEGQMVLVPEGCAHGYLTLEDNTELCYTASTAYAPGSARGVRFDDPAFGIEWPAAVTLISDADRNWPDFQPGDAVRLSEGIA